VQIAVAALDEAGALRWPTTVVAMQFQQMVVRSDHAAFASHLRVS
jgi:hypothetical protein